MTIRDVVVVGSGMSACHAAETLLERGVKVTLLDFGNQNDQYSGVVPDRHFLDLRSSDNKQSDYFLGYRLEGIPTGEVKHALTPPRQFIVKDTETYLPLESNDFNRMESLSYGGLGNGWGAGCAAYTDQELQRMGLSPSEMRLAYQTIARRIGVSGSIDDVSSFCSTGIEQAMMPPFEVDANITSIFDRYKNHRSTFNQAGVFLGRTPMAVLTRDFENRRAISYNDMEFWADHGASVYRPWVTLEKLKRNSNFELYKKSLVLKFSETNEGVRIDLIDRESNQREQLTAKKLILCAGAMGSARIVLRSTEKSEDRLPIITNAYSIAPCLNWRRIGKPLGRRRSSLGQLEIFLENKNAPTESRMVSLYTYRSLLLFKIIREFPLNMATGLKLMKFLQSSLVLATINHPDTSNHNKYLELVPDSLSATGDRLKVTYKYSDPEFIEINIQTKRILKTLRQLGCIPLKNQFMQPGSTVHYAGCLPYSAREKKFHLAPNGRLYGYQNVYVADGSGFTYLPANGLTFSLMANAHRIAQTLVI